MFESPNPTSLHQTALNTMRALGMDPDPWQMEVLAGGHDRLLLNCCRQAGKSTAAALLSVMETVGNEGNTTLMLAPSFRQSRLLFKTAAGILQKLGQRFIRRSTLHEIHLKNESQIVCLPCREETIRGYANVNLLLIDEAARVPDDLFRAVTPMLAVSDGRMICMSTPYGRRGFFYNAWSQGDSDWHRIEVPVSQVPRISRKYLEKARRTMGESWYRQEFCCSFEALEGLVFPDLARCVVPKQPIPPGRWFGGLDFGLRNPFAALWGVVDRDDVFWLVGEHYAREKPLAYHVQHLPRNVTWYADPEGAREITELRCANLAVRRGDNDQRPGIDTLRSRIETGGLRILEGSCPNLLREAQLYCYDPNSSSEKPVKENDHTLDALRYLFSKLDWKKMAIIRKDAAARGVPGDDDIEPGSVPSPTPVKPPEPPKRKWLSIHNEALWTRLG
jgi:hypothetical protein